MSQPHSQAEHIRRSFLRRPALRMFSDNERRVMALIRKAGTTSRTDLANLTGLTRQSIVRIAEELIDRRFVLGLERVIRGPGQPNQQIGLNADAAFCLGVSVTPYSMTAVLLDLCGAVRGTIQANFPTADRRACLGWIARQLDGFAGEGIDRNAVFGLGIAVPGFFVGDGTMLNAPVGMEEWAAADTVDALADAIDLPVWLENDGSAAAVGEAVCGVGQAFHSFAYLYVGAGLGGGVVMDGELLRGRNGNAGEFTGLLSIEERPDRPTLSLLRDMVLADGIACADLCALLADIDMQSDVVRDWLNRTKPSLDRIVSSIAAVLDPEIIVIGGQLPRSLAARLAAQAECYRAPVRDRERPFPRVVGSRATVDAAALGAASLPFKAHFF